MIGPLTPLGSTITASANPSRRLSDDARTRLTRLVLFCFEIGSSFSEGAGGPDRASLYVALRIPPMREAAMLPTTRPTPTCAHFRVTDLPCTTCGNKMRLILSEPRSQRFELMTYRCDCCGNVESFLSAI
jgi:hypothetical protein